MQFFKPPTVRTHSTDDSNIELTQDQSVVSIKEWPSEPKTLRRSVYVRLLNALYSLISILAPIPFLVLAGIAINRHNKNVQEDDWQRIQRGQNAVCSQSRLAHCMSLVGS